MFFLNHRIFSNGHGQNAKEKVNILNNLLTNGYVEYSFDYCMFCILFDRMEEPHCDEAKPKDAVSPQIAAVQRIFTLKLFSEKIASSPSKRSE